MIEDNLLYVVDIQNLDKECTIRKFINELKTYSNVIISEYYCNSRMDVFFNLALKDFLFIENTDKCEESIEISLFRYATLDVYAKNKKLKVCYTSIDTYINLIKDKISSKNIQKPYIGLGESLRIIGFATMMGINIFNKPLTHTYNMTHLTHSHEDFIEHLKRIESKERCKIDYKLRKMISEEHHSTEDLNAKIKIAVNDSKMDIIEQERNILDLELELKKAEVRYPICIKTIAHIKHRINKEKEILELMKAIIKEHRLDNDSGL